MDNINDKYVLGMDEDRLSPLSLTKSVDEKLQKNIENSHIESNYSIPVSPRMKNGIRVFSQSFLYACRSGLVRLIQELLRTGIDINCRSEDGLTGLMTACVFGQEEVVLALLKYDKINICISVDLNSNGKRYTALDLANEGNYSKIVQILQNYIMNSNKNHNFMNDNVKKFQHKSNEEASKENIKPPVVPIDVKNHNEVLHGSHSNITSQHGRSSTPDSINALTSNENSPSGTIGYDKLPTFVQHTSIPSIPGPLNLPHSSQYYHGNFTPATTDDNSISFQTPQRMTNIIGNSNSNMSSGNSIGTAGSLGLASVGSSPAQTNSNRTGTTYNTTTVNHSTSSSSSSSSSSSYHNSYTKWTPLMTDCRNGNIVAVRSLLESYVSVNEANDDGWTALMVAARFNNSSIINLLLQYGANLNATNKFGWTSLMMATRHGSSQAVTCLIKSPLWKVHNASINYSCSEGGWTALILAARHNEVEVARTLLNNGAHVNQQNQYGDTSIMWAARNNNLTMCRLLLEYGADAMIQDNRGRNSLQWIRDKTSSELINLLQSVQHHTQSHHDQYDQYDQYDHLTYGARSASGSMHMASLSAQSKQVSGLHPHNNTSVSRLHQSQMNSSSTGDNTSNLLLDLQNKINFKGFELGFWATDNASTTTSLPSSISVNSGAMNAGSIVEVTPPSSDNSDYEVESTTIRETKSVCMSKPPANWADAAAFTPQFQRDQEYSSHEPEHHISHLTPSFSTGMSFIDAHASTHSKMNTNTTWQSLNPTTDTTMNGTMNCDMNSGTSSVSVSGINPFSLFRGSSKSHYGGGDCKELDDDGYFADNQSLEGRK